MYLSDLLLNIGDYSGHFLSEGPGERVACECGKKWKNQDGDDTPEDHVTAHGAQALAQITDLPPAAADWFLATMNAFDGTVQEWVASCRDAVAHPADKGTNV